MKKSESITKLAAALVKAQGEIKAVKTNAVNPHLKNKYADLGAYIDEVKPALAKHGLVLTQFLASGEGCVGVTNLLMHESGEWIEETVLLPHTESKGRSPAQEAGSTISYLRRYSLAGIANLTAEDDDGGKPKPDAPVWTVAQKEAVGEAYDKPEVFLKYSGLPMDTSPDRIAEFAAQYTAHIVAGMDSKAAMKATKEGWKK